MSMSKILLAIALSGAALSAQAGISYSATSGSTPTGSAAGATVITFDNGLPVSNFASYDNAAAIMPVGGYSGISAPPPDDSTRYLSVGISGQPATASVNFSGHGASYFGFYMGSPDNYNIVTLYSGSTPVLQINGTAMASAAALVADGNQAHGFYMNFTTTAGTTISRVTFSSTDNAFETDNHAYIAAVPEPETYVMLLTGLCLVGFANRRRRPASEERFY